MSRLVNYFRRYLFWTPAPLWGALALMVSGCGSSAKLHLIQPSLPGWQQHLNLAAEQALWSPEGKTDRVLVDFPPPGATTGRALVVLYLRLPAGEAHPAVATNSGPCARGFFIQTRGEYAGLSMVVGGTIKVEGRSTSARAMRTIEFDLNTEDGSLLVGTIYARRDDWALHQFEIRRRPTDVALLKRESKSGSTTRKGP